MLLVRDSAILNYHWKIRKQSNQGIHVNTKPVREGTIGLYRRWMAIPTPREKPTPPKK